MTASPDAERRWSGAFRTCPACAKRNFAGRSRCSECGAALGRPAAPPSTAPAFFIGQRGSDRFQGRGVALAGTAIALVTLAGGILVYRFLRGPDWASAPEAARVAVTERTPSPTSEMVEAPASPAFYRPEDRANYEKGRRLLAAGDAKGALRPLTAAVRGLPREPVVVHDYGIALVRAGEVDRGLFQLEHASRLAPGIGAYRLDLIRALLAAGRRGPAARELKELLARDPTHTVALELLAGLGEATVSGGGVPVPSAAAGSVDMGGAASTAGSPRPVAGGGSFTNEDLERRRTAPPAPAPVRSPAAVAPVASAPAPALVASPSPPS